MSSLQKLLTFFSKKYHAKATHIFSAKNIRILYIEYTKTVNEMTLNELVKLTTLRTTGPWFGIANGQILLIFRQSYLPTTR